LLVGAFHLQSVFSLFIIMVPLVVAPSVDTYRWRGPFLSGDCGGQDRSVVA